MTFMESILLTEENFLVDKLTGNTIIFVFEITKKNEFLFYLTDKEKVTKMYRGNVKFLEAYKGPRIVLSVDTPRHHIIEDVPTLYRSIWSFYYVFPSPKFGNVFFTKGKWKPIRNSNVSKL